MDAKVRAINEQQNNSVQEAFLQDVVQGLSADKKTLPCKYFYDETGSKLFEDICELDEYYITRTELELIDSIKAELAVMIGKDAVIIEPGAGAGIKIQTLLSALKKPSLYVPIDISEDFLFYSAQEIQKRFPDVEIMPIQGDFTEPFKLNGKENLSNRIIFFPGSTIGNFTPVQAQQFLLNQAQLVGKNGAIIIGFDLAKAPSKLEAAYNDKKGVTAEFNKNLLHRINNELDADFNLSQFEHRAIFNSQKSRIEMYLKSKVDQAVSINLQQFEFSKSESIHTENSYKYSLESFAELVEKSGLVSQKQWIDKDELIAIQYLTCQ